MMKCCGDLGSIPIRCISFNFPIRYRGAEDLHVSGKENYTRAVKSDHHPGRILLSTVCFYVSLSGILCVFGCVSVVAVREVRVMGCFLVMAGFVMLRSFVVVVRSMFIMFGRLLVMMGCFL